MSIRIAVPKEITPDERRVALVPSSVASLTQMGATVLVEKDAGAAAFYADQDYQGAEIYTDAAKLYQDADIILKVAPPSKDEIAHCKKNAILLGFVYPTRYPDLVQALRDRPLTTFAIESLPRISRAQSMDALSSQATAAGYKAVLLAANLFDRFFPMLTTAAGTIRPASVLIIGAGVAGLQAIATAKRLGAVVKAYDIRSAAREQVESLGAQMVQIDIKAEAAGGYARELSEEEKQAQQTALSDAIAKADIVITTALIPGRPAPKIITRTMVEAMAPGSVIVDIAAEAGGNCELTQAGQMVSHQQVNIYGPLNLPSMLARDASNMYAKNLVNFLKLIIQDGQLALDWQDPILAQSVLTHEGEIKMPAIADIIAGTGKKS